MYTKTIIYFTFVVISVFTGPTQGYRCENNGAFVDDMYICDGTPQCSDASDEKTDLCILPYSLTYEEDFKCENGFSIPHEKYCDGVIDCRNGEDEVLLECLKQILPCTISKPIGYMSYIYSDCRNDSCIVKYNGKFYVAFKTEVKVTCEHGYIPTSSATSTCIGKKWVPELPTCEPNERELLCPPIDVTKGIEQISCKHKTILDADCLTPSHTDTNLTYTCKPFYRKTSDTATCLASGKWSSEVKCLPICGEIKKDVRMIMRGSKVKVGEWPWAAAMYQILPNNTWDFFCGGTLVSENAVVTAAHCVWEIDPADFAVTVGNIYKDNSPLNEKHELSRQVYKVKKIVLPHSYQDYSGNYGSDIAVLLLNDSVTLTEDVRPACLPQENHYDHIYPIPGDIVRVAGWGLNEGHASSEALNIIKVPMVSYKTCVESEPWDFRKYITHTTMCAGYLNGTSVCNGDSGSGMMYFHDNKWELVGIVSISPRERGTSYCQLKNSYALFTKVISFLPWLTRTAFD